MDYELYFAQVTRYVPLYRDVHDLSSHTATPADLLQRLREVMFPYAAEPVPVIVAVYQLLPSDLMIDAAYVVKFATPFVTDDAGALTDNDCNFFLDTLRFDGERPEYVNIVRLGEPLHQWSADTQEIRTHGRQTVMNATFVNTVGAVLHVPFMDEVVHLALADSVTCTPAKRYTGTMTRFNLVMESSHHGLRYIGVKFAN
jgi:hypothetical protein